MLDRSDDNTHTPNIVLISDSLLLYSPVFTLPSPYSRTIVSLRLPATLPAISRPQDTYWCYNSADWDAFRKFLVSCLWNDGCSNLVVSKSVPNFAEVFRDMNFFCYRQIRNPQIV